jgi:hypothetical protein
MKINEYSPVGKTSSVTKKKNVSSVDPGGDFLGLLSANEVGTTSPTAPPADVQSVTSMDALLTLQEMPENEIEKRKAVQEGKGALETLEKLRHDLLTGTISGNIIDRLNDVIKLKKQVVNDSKLGAIIQDIELRAAVELAKLERASKNN